MNSDSSDNSELDELQERIQRLKEKSPETTSQIPVAGMHLVFAMGFTVIGSLMAGDYFGSYLSQKAGNPQYSLVGWLLGLGLAVFSVIGLLRPYMK